MPKMSHLYFVTPKREGPFYEIFFYLNTYPGSQGRLAQWKNVCFVKFSSLGTRVRLSAQDFFRCEHLLLIGESQFISDN